ncbi:uncharacterized protein LOC122058080 isoform X1 [Macadamia integrifolia]|uniref:uncharacterized protein LOC122058080 isoform X1 n=1 Tax=Macadamia integrifolia TaxID=60698 RepID=UPI001C52AF4E|nr:uncharacterized protein LOC122058080 isoform X1 [Macadamia integrifolia]
MALPSSSTLPQCTDQTPLSEETTTPQINPSTTLQAGSLEDAHNVLERKPDLVERFLESWLGATTVGCQECLYSCDSDTPDYTEKYNKYEADYVRRLKAKYFSKKDLYGGIIFDKEDAIDDEIIKSSRFPSTRSFTDPVNSFEDQSRFSASAAESSANHPNRKPQCKKSNS